MDDSLESLKIPGTNYYDFVELNEQMQIRYGFELTEREINGLFKRRSETIPKKTKLGKVKYVLDQLAESAKNEEHGLEINQGSPLKI